MVTSQDFIQYQRLQALHWTVLPTWHTKRKRKREKMGSITFSSIDLPVVHGFFHR